MNTGNASTHRPGLPARTWRAWWLAWFLAVAPGQASELEARWMAGPAPLAPGQTEVTNVHGQVLTFTRWDVLLSNVAFHRPDGGWLARTNWVAVLEAFGESAVIRLGLPPGTYDRVRFDLGLSPEMNARDAAQWPPGHPLNPARSTLHWGWAGGWVFAAIEGRWRDGAQPGSGFSFHLAGDALRTRVDRPLALDARGTARVILTFDGPRFVAGMPRLEAGKAATHSREGDRLAPALMQALADAVRVETDQGGAKEPGPVDSGGLKLAGSGGPPASTAPGAHPYRLVIPAGFPRPSLPLDNPLTEEGVRLGRRLFNEPLLSRDGRLSCAGCHDPARGFTDGQAVSTGVDGHRGTRSSMPLYNLAWKSSFFWDGRARTLREQVLQPITHPAEMGESLPAVLEKLRRRSGPDGYPAAFQEAFGTAEIDADRLARALEQFLLVQVAGDSRFDRVMRGEAKFTADEARGFELFHTEFDPTRGLRGADCFHCHGGALFVSQRFGNNGLRARSPDRGRAAVTGRPADEGLFAVPSLRLVSRTAPYMHDGRFATLEEVVKHYCEGLVPGPTLDPNLAKHPVGGLGLGLDDQQALVAFLRTL